MAIRKIVGFALLAPLLIFMYGSAIQTMLRAPPELLLRILIIFCLASMYGVGLYLVLNTQSSEKQ